jgi:putative hemolysin
MTFVAITVLLAVSFIFSGIEAGILSVNRVRLKHRATKGDPAAIKLSRLLAKPERLLVTVVVVTNLMNITAITLATQAIVNWLGHPGYLVTLLLFLPIYLLGLELLPKSMFRRFPYRALAALAEPLRLADALLAPLHFIGWQLSRMLLGHHPPEQRKLFVAREDFKYLTIESERTGALSRTEREMINNVVDFRAVLTRDVMTPMDRVPTIRARASIEELLGRAKSARFDRWPVVGEDGQITGLIDIFDVALDGRRQGNVEPFQRRVVRADEKEPAYAVLRKLRAARSKLAVVRGAAGRDIGIVTSEALVHRLVGVAGKAAPGAGPPSSEN